MDNLNPFNSQSDLYSSLLQQSLKNNYPFAGKLIHARIIKTGLHLGVFLINNLINVYAKTGNISDAHKLLDEMPLKNSSSWNTLLSSYAKQGRINVARLVFEEMPEPDAVSWTSMIVGYNQMGQFVNAIRMFLEMITFQVAPTEYTMTNILASCASINALDVGKKVHTFVVKLGLSSFISVANSLLNMYTKSGDPVSTKFIFDRMRLKSTSSWNAMISFHMQNGRCDLALEQFRLMSERDIVSWNSMISGYNQQGFDAEALNMFSKMSRDTLLKPDKYTLTSALAACANLEDMNLGKQIHAYIIRTNYDTSGTVGNALISMYSKSGSVEIAQKVLEKSMISSLNVITLTALVDGHIKLGNIDHARQIFDSVRDRDVVSWTAMIVGYVQNGNNYEALQLFRSMVRNGPNPNSYTLAAILSVSSSLASLDHGKQIHSRALRFGQESSISVSNALINMYAKAGSVTAARLVFNLIPRNTDTVSWTSIIIALAQHGLGEESIELFEQMLAFRINPDHITYVGVLSACTHMGSVKQGREYFKMLKDVHGIEPTPSHYACMIDLYGRAGMLQEAQEFIDNMPIEPDIVAWGSLLASCKVHKNVELAKVAAERMLQIEPENSGAYTALANLYSICGKWQDAAMIRKSMKDRQVKKEQGFSWVQIRNEVHVFGVEDGLHPQRYAIYQMMAKIWKEIKKMGFIPQTESVLHDLDEELKEQLLRHHSEKLAIAFALLNTPGNAALRIMKNLRVCNDCHSAIKFISQLVGREIIVRDATRFHHFKGGSCSCRDYW